MLFEAQVFAHVSGDGGFADSPKLWYRLQQMCEPLVLNTWRVWNDRLDPDAAAMVGRLLKMIRGICSDHTDRTDMLVDFDAVESDERFAIFEELTCEIQKVSGGERGVRVFISVHFSSSHWRWSVV